MFPLVLVANFRAKCGQSVFLKLVSKLNFATIDNLGQQSCKTFRTLMCNVKSCTCDCAIYNKVLQYEKCAWETKNGAFLPHFSIEFIQKNTLSLSLLLPPFPLTPCIERSPKLFGRYTPSQLCLIRKA
jgi:hypothetical protein